MREEGARVINILLLDDEANLRKVLSRFFVARGYAVATAATGDQARGMIAASCPDLLITDLVRAGEDGFEFIRGLRATQASSRLPVIVLSAQRDSARVAVAYESGADRVLGKPVDLAVLRAAVDELVGERPPADDRGAR